VCFSLLFTGLWIGSMESGFHKHVAYARM
jgi:hypothetical protein